MSSNATMPSAPQMVDILVDTMEQKSTTPVLKSFIQALAGGAFIALGFAMYINTEVGAAALTPGVGKLLGGLVFSVGLMMVVITGAELFTSTTMAIAAKASGRITWAQLGSHWLRSYVGNFVGSLLVMALCYYGGMQNRNDGAWGQVVVDSAVTKVSHSWVEAFVLGIGANLLVCMAVLMSYSGRSTADKLLAVIGPVTLFVAMGFEHSVANMFLIPYGIILGDPSLTWGHFILANLIPVTLGNIVGGGVLVGLYQWWVHQKLGKH